MNDTYKKQLTLLIEKYIGCGLKNIKEKILSLDNNIYQNIFSVLSREEKRIKQSDEGGFRNTKMTTNFNRISFIIGERLRLQGLNGQQIHIETRQKIDKILLDNLEEITDDVINILEIK